MKEHVLATMLAICALLVLLSVTLTAQPLRELLGQALDAGDTDAAIELLQDAIQDDPSYHINYYLLARIYYDLGRFAEAKEQFQHALDKKSKHYESLYYLGRSQIWLDEIDEADEVMTRGLKKSRDLKAWFENGIGLVALAREDYGNADRAFRRALAENEAKEAKELKDLRESPYSQEERQLLIDSAKARYAKESAEYHVNLGDANFYQGVPSLAILEYEQALAIDTASTEVYFHWAEACLEIKDYNCAIEKLRIVLTKDSTYAAAWNRAGGIYFKAARSSHDRQERKNRYIDAIGSYKKYVELARAGPDSSNVRAFFELAMSYAGISGYEDAVDYFEKVLSIPYEPKDVYFHYGKSLWGIREYVRAAEVLGKHQEWVAGQGDDYESSISEVEFYQLLGDSYFYRKPKDFSTAIAHYKKSLEQRPNQRRLLQNVAVAYHSLKSYSQAIEYYDRRIELGIDSNTVSIYKNAGLCALNLAGSAGDDEDLDELEEEEFEEASAPDRNYFEVAIDYMNKYLQHLPDDTTVILRVANTYLYQLEDCANGVSAFERLLVLDPGNCLAKKSLGYAYFGGICNKNYSKALTYLLDAHRCFSSASGPCADAALVKWIAQAYHLRAVDRTGDSNSDYKNAFEWYGKCLKCNPTDTDCKEGQNDTQFEFN